MVQRLKLECAGKDMSGHARSARQVASSLQRYLLFAILSCIPDRCGPRPLGGEGGGQSRTDAGSVRGGHRLASCGREKGEGGEEEGVKGSWGVKGCPPQVLGSDCG